MQYKISKGNSYPLGAAFDKKGGINFALFSKNAKAVSIEFFTLGELAAPFWRADLSPKKNRTGDVWHALITGLPHDVCYAYRLDGDYTPAKNGHRFNRNKLLIDPYGKALIGKLRWKDDESYSYDRSAARDRDLVPSHVDNTASSMKCLVVDDSQFDWEDDHPPRTPLSKSVIYEVHARGFTMHPSSGAARPGTFLGVIEKIPYLSDLGVTAIELLPVHEYNENEIIRVNPLTGERLKNYWGYNSLSFFALNNVFAGSKEPAAVVNEFKTMVRELHKAGIEVILDVVYNHTGEGNEVGPTFSFRGLDNAVYYHLENSRFYKNYSGCGNTLNCNHLAVKQMILDSLRYFVTEMHVDGFRFDLASILGRGATGEWIGENSLLRDIQEDPILSGTKLIAEGWDAAGCYKVGEFPGGWAEWNGKYRDDVRSFLRGDEGHVSSMATRICGSPDLYGDDRAPYHSINFITCHDGFTMRDLVSYSRKNNLANGEENRDGSDDNRSQNFGFEGETGDQSVNDMRMRQVKNYVTALMISQGTPMLLGGDEIYRTQRGNNNCYCQDNELSWHDWSNIERYPQIFNFFKKIIAFRKANPVFCLDEFPAPLEASAAKKLGVGGFISWHGVKLGQPDWAGHSRTLAFTINGIPEITGVAGYDRRFHVVMNSYGQKLDFDVPRCRHQRRWHLAVNTAEPAGRDIFTEAEMPAFPSRTISAQPRSIVILAEK